MPFTAFTIPKTLPTETCNGRMRNEDGTESYCSVPAQGRRCPAHDGSNVKKTKERKAQQVQTDSRTVDQVVQYWLEQEDMWSQRKNTLSLDRQLFTLAILIDELGNRKPLASMTEEEVEHLAKLTKNYAELALARVETTLKVWDKVSEHWRGSERFDDYLALLLGELMVVYDVDLWDMKKQREAKKVQAQQTNQATTSNGNTGAQTT